MTKLLFILLLLPGCGLVDNIINCKGNCNNGEGTYTYYHGVYYVGEWKDGYRHGEGIHVFANGAKYEGEWKNNSMHGEGTLTYANGDQYVGEFKDSSKHGKGTYIYANGDQYIGEFKDGSKHGKGTYIYANGDQYVGEWTYDSKDEEGTYTWASEKSIVKESIDNRINNLDFNYFNSYSDFPKEIEFGINFPEGWVVKNPVTDSNIIKKAIFEQDNTDMQRLLIEKFPELGIPSENMTSEEIIAKSSPHKIKQYQEFILEHRAENINRAEMKIYFYDKLSLEYLGVDFDSFLGELSAHYQDLGYDMLDWEEMILNNQKVVFASSRDIVNDFHFIDCYFNMKNYMIQVQGQVISKDTDFIEKNMTIIYNSINSFTIND